MNKFIVFLGSLFLLLLSHGHAQNLPAGSTGAVVKIMKGQPIYKAGEQVLPITKGMTIKAGWTVVTGDGQLVILRLSNGGKIVVYAHSEVTLKAETEDLSKIELHQPKGFTWSRLPKLKDGDSFSVVTSNYTAGVRGTAFSVGSKENGETQVCVCEGLVLVVGVEGETTVGKGEIVHAQPGQALSPMKDDQFLKHPDAAHRSCIDCHQGGYSRDSLYR